MPNIIEQQDLLKGLPDNRLAMLMQNPTGEIPPFLVAAEAQRRQSIRQQFSGGPQESVVDTLTKQLSNVPQNIQAPAQTPPQMPPPQMPPQMQQQAPQMAGVAALQGQQGMRRGGVVQRYQTGSLVRPTVSSMSSQYYVDPFGAPDTSGGDMSVLENAIPDLGLPPIFPQWKTPEQLAAERQANADQGSASDPYKYGMSGIERRTMPASVQTASPVNVPPDPNAGKTDTSVQNQMPPEEYRKRLEAIYGTNPEDTAFINKKLEELYGGESLSSWERAQKWFDAAQAAIQPGQSDAQAIVNALSAFGGGYAQERETERADKRAMQEALLRQEIADRQAQREGQSNIEKGVLDYQLKLAEIQKAQNTAAREEQLSAYKLYADKSSGKLKEANDTLLSLERRRDDYIKSIREKSLTGEMPDLSKDPYIIALDKQIEDVQRMIFGAEASGKSALANYGKITGTDPSVTVFTGDSLATFNR